jgi:hypothetical protein
LTNSVTKNEAADKRSFFFSSSARHS